MSVMTIAVFAVVLIAAIAVAGYTIGSMWDDFLDAIRSGQDQNIPSPQADPLPKRAIRIKPNTLPGWRRVATGLAIVVKLDYVLLK